LIYYYIFLFFYCSYFSAFEVCYVGSGGILEITCFNLEFFVLIDGDFVIYCFGGGEIPDCSFRKVSLM
jgi:hypothetical protein